MFRVLAICLVGLVLNTQAQEDVITQVVRGKLTDEESGFQVIGATVCLFKGQQQIKCTSADAEGKFRLEGIPIGTYQMHFSAIGYKPQNLAEVHVISGQQTVLNLKMAESVAELEAFEVTAEKKGQSMNEMTTVSSRAFSIEESQRYAASRGDPARMATNYAGCQGTDDSRNDVVVRGNSPSGVLYRLHGIDMPNPNHFAIAGTGGGPISIINSKVLGTSDFYTGAFPAEISNTISGAFDLRLKNGNAEKMEFTGQVGLFGTELLLESPLNKKKGSSIIATYRYATFELFQAAGIDLGTDAVPKYQDFSFNIRLPQGENGEWRIFALGGNSKIDLKISDQTDTSAIDLYGANDRDQYFRTGVLMSGISYMKTLNEKTRISFTGAYAGDYNRSNHELVYRHVDAEGNFVLDSLEDLLRYRYVTQKGSFAARLNHKVDKKNSIRAGLTFDQLFFDYTDSIRDIATDTWLRRWRANTNAFMARGFLQWKHKFSDKVWLNAGINSQYYSLGDALSPIEPRLGLKYAAEKNQFFAVGMGLHSQWQPNYLYFYQVPIDSLNITTSLNSDMGFTKSWHFVGSYDKYFESGFHFKSEIYYQTLFDIPVTKAPSSFSMVNQGSGFSRLFPAELVNEGTGKNYGVEMTLEKAFSNNLYILVTGSVFESRYTGSDGIERNSSYNGNYMGNFLLGKEFSITEKSIIGLGAKVTYGGGKRYGFVDTLQSNLQREVVYMDSLFNERQFRDYFRADLKIYWKKNAKKVTHEFALDLANITDQQNILSLTYAPNPNNPLQDPIRENYQLGFLPMFYYQIRF